MNFQIAALWLFSLLLWLLTPWYARNVLGHPADDSPASVRERFEGVVLPRRVAIMRVYLVAFALIATLVEWGS